MEVRLRKIIQDGKHVRLESESDDLLLYLIRPLNRQEERQMDFAKQGEWRIWGIHKIFPLYPRSHPGHCVLHGEEGEVH